MPVRVSVVNDYSIVVAGVHAYLAPFADRVELVETGTVRSGDTPVDVALYDTFTAPVGKHARLRELLDDPTIGAVAVYSFSTDPQAVADTLEAGARGFLAKSLLAAELVEAIERIAAGDTVTMLGSGVETMESGQWPARDVGLTARESEVVGLIVQGRSNEEIASACYLSINTVKSYIREAYRKMGVTTRAQAVAWGMKHHLAPDR